MTMNHALACYLEGLQIAVLSSFKWSAKRCFEEGKKIRGEGEKANIYEREMVATFGLLMNSRYSLVRNIFNLPIENHDLPVIKQLLKYKEELIAGYNESLTRFKENPKTVNDFAKYSTLIFNYGLKNTVDFHSVRDIPTMSEWTGVIVANDDKIL